MITATPLPSHQPFYIDTHSPETGLVRLPVLSLQHPVEPGRWAEFEFTSAGLLDTALSTLGKPMGTAAFQCRLQLQCWPHVRSLTQAGARTMCGGTLQNTSSSQGHGWQACGSASTSTSTSTSAASSARTRRYTGLADGVPRLFPPYFFFPYHISVYMR